MHVMRHTMFIRKEKVNKERGKRGESLRSRAKVTIESIGSRI